MLRQYHDTKIVDFHLMPPSKISPGEMTVTAIAEVDDSRYIQIIGLPDFKVTHHLRVAADSWLVEVQPGKGAARELDGEVGVRFVEGLRGRDDRCVQVFRDGCVTVIFLNLYNK